MDGDTEFFCVLVGVVGIHAFPPSCWWGYMRGLEVVCFVGICGGPSVVGGGEGVAFLSKKLVVGG